MHAVIPTLLGHRQTGNLLQRLWLNQGGYTPTALDQRCKEGTRTPQTAAVEGLQQFTRHCADGQSQATIKTPFAFRRSWCSRRTVGFGCSHDVSERQALSTVVLHSSQPCSVANCQTQKRRTLHA